MSRFSAVIIDDEPLAREGLRQLLTAEPDITVAGEASDGIEASELISRTNPDIVFLDIQMPGLNGIEVVEAMAARPPNEHVPAIVFVTAFDTFAVEAFRVHAADYLLKPLDADRFREAIATIRSRAADGNASSQFDLASMIPLMKEIASKREYPQRLVIREGGRVFFVETKEISHIEAAGDYACVHCRGAKHLLHETMAHLHARLDPRVFLRIHRSIIVNVQFIKELHPLFRGDYSVVLTDGRKVSMSRRYREQVMAALESR